MYHYSKYSTEDSLDVDDDGDEDDDDENLNEVL